MADVAASGVGGDSPAPQAAGASSESKAAEAAEPKLKLSASRVVFHNFSADDLRVYVDKYQGHGKLHRLLFIATHCPALSADAFRMAHDMLKADAKNTGAYRDVCEGGAAVLGPECALDEAWITETNSKADGARTMLERDLATHLANQSRYHIRRGNIDLARFYHETGNLPQAQACYNRAFDYCSPQEKAEHFATVAQLALEMNNYGQVGVFLRKMRSYPADAMLLNKAHVLQGIAQLHFRDYKAAATEFTNVSAEAHGHFAELTTPEDLALYGGLCALASFSRAELRLKVVESKSFSALLDLSPRVKKAVMSFYHSDYSSCLASLQALHDSLAVDMHVSLIMNDLVSRIRARGITQYFMPYSAVNLVTMATAFNTSVEELTESIADLIMSGKMQARIDSHNKVLVSRSADVRVDAFAGAMKMGKAFARDAQSMILRVKMAENKFVVKHSRRRGRGGMGAGAAAGDRGGMGGDFDMAELEAAREASLMAATAGSTGDTPAAAGDAGGDVTM